MAQLNTRIILRNDSSANWLANSKQILLKGELGIEFLEDGAVKIKIGDGAKSWEELDYFGGDLSDLLGDNKTIAIEDGKIKIIGFADAEVGAQPRKNANGEIEWVVPSTETVEGLQSAVAGLQSDITSLQEIVGVNVSEGDSLITKITNTEDALNILNGDETVEGSVKKTVADEINAFANSITDDGVVNSYKELIDYVAEHGSEAANMASDITMLQGLVGDTPVNEQIINAITASGHIAENKADAIFKKVKYEISHKPVGTLVDYRDKEIRVMCPANTVWTKQNVGATGNANMYYMGFKAYAPEGAVGFKEGDQGVIEDEYFDFTGDFAGTDEFGRNYSIVWLALASYDPDSDTWTYFGKNSSTKKYIGWTYVVEWYDADGVVIDSDRIRINLSNESCHDEIKPFYLGDLTGVIEGISIGGTLLEAVNDIIDIPIATEVAPGVVKGAVGENKIKVNADGTMEVDTININRIVQSEDETLILCGGDSAVESTAIE